VFAFAEDQASLVSIKWKNFKVRWNYEIQKTLLSLNLNKSLNVFLNTSGLSEHTEKKFLKLFGS